jgi:anaerobic magnesium-protoporphyrin IX monomethyl ester cyclase
MANWAMYTPWPFSDMFAELDDKVEVYDFDKYNFVTPIIKPDQMDRAEVLDHVMHNYRRFYMKKSFFSYPWTLDKAKRKYLLGCLKAYALSGFKRKFYDLGRVNYWGSKKTVDFDFDESKTTIVQPSLGEWKQAPRKKLERARNVAREAQINKEAARERAKEEAARIKANGGDQTGAGSSEGVPTRGGEPASLNKRREREGREQRARETTPAE